MAEKRCSRCGEIKSLDDFHRDKRRRDGRGCRCKKCGCANTRAWRAKYPERAKESDRQNRERHSEVRAEYKRQWKEANPEKVRASSQRYYARNGKDRLRRYDAEHPERTSARHHRWRARKLNATLDPPTALSECITRLREANCLYCGRPGEDIDHLVPLASGGGHTVTNLASACARCNRSKGALSPSAFLGSENLHVYVVAPCA